ncbi:hypothetical protein A3766_05935 [Oleiphilus sp. HI0132]|uniref:hypothetical protein n=1 Tax=Oleiphilus sp. HI0132 TaxID=1822270 RepID=UPI0007C3052F|nr:hypothetical protein [Oleiphilus sp. HI0132]KZZ73326.1 hypothetical protein A3766_05935 [Oleiphilus sp. HI0132]
MNMVKTSVVFVVLFAISLSTFAAKNDTAFELFTDAERALEEGDLNESKRLAENAINLVPGDGRITIIIPNWF